MARIRKERNCSTLTKEDRLRTKLQPSLDVSWLYYVKVFGFTFEFGSLEQIQEYIDFYSIKIHPSSRSADHCLPNSGLFSPLDHWERQTKFDKLPLHLREETKREKVVQALSQAQTTFGWRQKQTAESL